MNNAMTTEQKKFNAATRKAIKLIRQLNNWASEGYAPVAIQCRKAIEKAEDLTRFLDNSDMQYAVCSGLQAARRFAVKQAQHNLQEWRYSEIARLKSEAREKSPQPGSFRHELLTRGCG